MISIGQLFYTLVYQIFYYLCGGKAILHDIVYRRFNKFELPNRKEDVAVITGGGRGIGFHVVNKLLASNMKVIIGCRNVDQVKKKFNSEDNLEVLHLDMKSLESVYSFAKVVRDKYPAINVLVNNAGVMFVPYELTKDGVECHLAVNYLSHFFLSLLLLPTLIKGGTRESKSRIVNVTSCAHEVSPRIDFSDLNMSKAYIANAAYARSKLAQILSTKRLAALFQQHCPTVDIVSVHPGIVDTELFNGTILKVTAPWVLRYICKSPEQGATTVSHACLGPLDTEGINSSLYYSNCRQDTPHPMCDNLATQQTLLAASLTSLKQYYDDIPVFLREFM
uniref:Dehydrogenase/reductase SDR family member on chromosome X n=1 Tax=Cacopsylla melanoneura TaxID=428564 RepID=A0A8D8YYJ9_9HEMI